MSDTAVRLEQQQPPAATTTAAPQVPAVLPRYLQFTFGGLAGMGATMIVQPFDVVKTRMQLSQRAHGVPTEGVLRMLGNLLKAGGVRELYAGLSAALFRQVTYTTTRLGAFGIITDELTRYRATRALSSSSSSSPSAAPSADAGRLSFGLKLVAGLSAGAIGACVGNPAEVALVRMMADGRLPPEQRRNYHSVFDALARIVREEGVRTLWRGVSPTIGRAALLNMAQLGTYAQTKEAIVSAGLLGDHIGAHVVASTVSGFAATCISLPLDNAKTKLQNMRDSEFNGMLDALQKTARADGVPALWRGFWPYFMRLAPHTVAAFVILEQLKAAYWRTVRVASAE
ncbi:hypothetical protein CDCA_CDCA20G4842 [Cyanidium caldarium]|uniref:Mitochondrial 2-oxoglutarate/malate carrier protein n=1 Tax=Cyanidium caldarium TaxID=2771 RepID=A0AAV9J2J5_CYACA|nr:hypothetical protein CDCA_CDCA20G4842 [Cyanidium caldarium]